MGIQQQLDAINAANAAIRAILDAVFTQVLRDLEDVDPSKYRLYEIGGPSGLSLHTDGRVILQAIEDKAFGDYGPQVTVPMEVIDNGTLAQWIEEEKIRRAEKREEERRETAEKWEAQRAGRSRIFRGEV